MRIVVLDSLRGLFAVSIVLLHSPFQGSLHYNSFVSNSADFVDFFFVLSGFVITLAYDTYVRDGRTLAEFMIRRVGRLWPLHVFVLLMFLLMIAVKIVASRLGLFSADLTFSNLEIEHYALENFFLVQAFRNETVFWLNFPSWSISVELWVYVAFGLLCLTPRFLPFAAIAIIVLAAAVIQGLLDPGFGHFFGYGLFRGLCYFFLGYLTCLLWRRLRERPLPAPHLLETGLVVLIVWEVAFGNGPVKFYLLPLTFALTILVFAWEAGIVSRLLRTRPLLALGAWSYSIYMIHILVFSVFGLGLRVVERTMRWNLHSPDLLDPTVNELTDLGAPLINDIAMICIAAVVVACASVTYRLIELPGQKVARRVARGLEARLAVGH